METRVFTVTTAKAGNVNKRRPVIKLQGDWLDKIGFKNGELADAEYEKGKITLRLHDSSQSKNLKKDALEPSSGLFQVRREPKGKKLFSQIDLKGFWLERFGFTIGSFFAARYEYGLIKLLLIDPKQFPE